MTEKIIYEQPLNERIRTFLRLEFLFAQASHHLSGPSQWDSRATLNCLLDVLSIFGRTEIKTEVLKELERHSTTLGKLSSNPDIDLKRLEQIQTELGQLANRLHQSSGPIAADLKANEFLSSIQQRSAIPGGTCDFDLPAYHLWLKQPVQQRSKDLTAWLGRFEAIAQAIQLILKLIRESSCFQPLTTENGFYQKTMDPNLPCQMVRVAVPVSTPYFAEISGGRHRFTIRFLNTSKDDGHIKQATTDISFELGSCII